ncbi:hypothetical protein HBE96_17500 [Clostridium sp. P21]|uniref:Uncharacterized protein n=1 Tax=Clostridium muellerianum TaxID=2716538 RepID=A0A7Y0EJ40_9CLOT|nr:hypothetical protein [Clostridium muellerianum]NMM64418.1 hypothetical protein [Clostridium muellerianum]
MKNYNNEDKKNVEAAKKGKKAVKKIRRRESHRFLFDMIGALFTRG